MKKVALMQPYLFPYLGYFQLIQSVDLFIVYDDVQWIKGGWINRNRILSNGLPAYLTLPVKKGSVKDYINQREFVDDIETKKAEMLEWLTECYADAPYFSEVFDLVRKSLSFDESIVSLFVINSIRLICEYIGVETEIILSSSIAGKNENLRGQDRVIDIVKTMAATRYVNAIGGQELYDQEAFANHGIELAFIKSGEIKYKQRNKPFVPGLSIIDVMMFNSPDEIKGMLQNYELI